MERQGTNLQASLWGTSGAIRFKYSQKQATFTNKNEKLTP